MSLSRTFTTWMIGGAVVGIAARSAWSYYTRNLITRAARDNMAQAIRNIDSDDLSVETSIAATRTWGSGVRTQMIAAAVSRDCRTQFGFASETEANKLVARKWIHDAIMANPDMRRCDASRIMGLAMILVFVPDAAEVEREQMKVAYSRIKRDREYATKWWDWGFTSPSTPLSG